jgi:formamidopyrimidine-DNA glycosylase
VPEIAEVEIVRRGLESELLGRRLHKLEVFDQKLAAAGSERAFAGLELGAVGRHGKLLGLHFAPAASDRELTLAVHLRMTGSLLLGEEDAEAGRARALWRFAGRSLRFVDPRRFGTLEVTSPARFGAALGPDLLDPDLRWPPPALRQAKRQLKAALLDQKLIAGVGNYLADESLWRAEIDPRRSASELEPGQWARLGEELQMLVAAAIEAGGVSIRDYVDASGQEGEMAAQLYCYGHGGEPCLRCGQTLRQGRVAGRGTVWCAACQL